MRGCTPWRRRRRCRCHLRVAAASAEGDRTLASGSEFSDVVVASGGCEAIAHGRKARCERGTDRQTATEPVRASTCASVPAPQPVFMLCVVRMIMRVDVQVVQLLCIPWFEWREVTRHASAPKEAPDCGPSRSRESLVDRLAARSAAGERGYVWRVRCARSLERLG